MSTPSIKRHIGRFHVVVVKNVLEMYLKAWCTCRAVVLVIEPIVYWRCCSRRRRSCLRSLLTVCCDQALSSGNDINVFWIPNPRRSPPELACSPLIVTVSNGGRVPFAQLKIQKDVAYFPLWHLFSTFFCALGFPLVSSLSARPSCRLLRPTWKNWTGLIMRLR